MHERERWRLIGAMLRKRPMLTVRELVAATGSSAATIRRDLVQLERDGQLRRVHGGVEAVRDIVPPELATNGFDDSLIVHLDRKRAIARAAVEMCEDGEPIIINAGTTAFEMVGPLTQRRLTVLTNSFPVAQALISRSLNRVIVPGGEIYRKQGIILSPFDDDAIQHYAASKMFMSGTGIGPNGVMEGDPLLARAEAKLLSRAERLIVLADSSKFDGRGVIAVCPLSRIDTLITDDAAPVASLDMLRKAGITVRVVRVEAGCGEIASSAA